MNLIKKLLIKLSAVAIAVGPFIGCDAGYNETGDKLNNTIYDVADLIPKKQIVQIYDKEPDFITHYKKTIETEYPYVRYNVPEVSFSTITNVRKNEDVLPAVKETMYFLLDDMLKKNLITQEEYAIGRMNVKTIQDSDIPEELRKSCLSARTTYVLHNILLILDMFALVWAVGATIPALAIVFGKLYI